MKINIFQWRYSSFLILIALWLPTHSAQAAITCTASMTDVNLGSISSANSGSSTITGTLSYECKSTYAAPRYVSICLGVDGGSYGSNVVAPRYMSTTGSSTPSTPRLAFTMTLPGPVLWGTHAGAGSEYKDKKQNLAYRSISGSVPIKVSLVPSSDNNLATPGTYINSFGLTELAFDVGTPYGDGSLVDCTGADRTINKFPFKVEATVIASCEITTKSEVNLGSKSADTINIEGVKTNAIGVTCTNGAPYKIGLSPSNGNTAGSGAMKGSVGNSDEVPYQLRSAAGMSGAILGNNGSTVATLTNGVTGTGNGLEQLRNVYATVPSADFKPDNYSDKVTINVYY